MMDRPRVVVVSWLYDAELFAAIAGEGVDVEVIDDVSVLVSPREHPIPPITEFAAVKEPHKTHGPQKIGRKGKVKRW